MIRIIATAALAFSVIASTVALARPVATTDAVPTQSVAYADLNLASPAGMMVLHNRVSSAIRVVCGNSDVRDLRAMQSARTCQRTARSSADAQIALAAGTAQQSAVRALRLRIASR